MVKSWLVTIFCLLLALAIILVGNEQDNVKLGNALVIIGAFLGGWTIFATVAEMVFFPPRTRKKP